MPTNPVSGPVGYVLKRYPRYSETFIVNEILAHEAAGQEIEIFALNHPVDTHFQNLISRVKAPVHYVTASGLKPAHLWDELVRAGDVLPDLWSGLPDIRGADVHDAYRAVALARLARETGVTHLHAHFATIATDVVRLAARLTGLPYSFTAHAKDIYQDDVDDEAMKRKLRDAAAVITVSDYNLDHLRQRYGADASTVTRIHNGLCLENFTYSEPRSRPPQIVAVGRLVEKKGFADLIDACAVLAKGGRDFNCRIIGCGELEEELTARIVARGLVGPVELVGPRPQSELVELVSEAAVLAAPCVVAENGDRDGMPTAILESMALGTPCVGTNVTGIPEILHHNRTGLVTPQKEPSALAEALGRLLGDEEMRVRLATEARQLIETSFDIHANATRLRKVFGTGQAPVQAPARRIEEVA
jgi:glycosyltransferase involved in cell wall biosynthesis